MNEVHDIAKLTATQPVEERRILSAFSPKRTEWALATLSFLESSFVPIVIDPFLIGAIALHRERWHRYVLVTVVSSVLGACTAYFAGAFFWDAFGARLLAWMHAEQAFEGVRALVTRGEVMFTLIGAITPVPYKLTSLAGGMFHFNIPLFIVASLFGRYVRFVAVGYLAYIGRSHGRALLRHITWRRMFLVGFVLGAAAIAFLFR